ncbi:DUF6308 family protein [Arthrobacter sp. B1805]|uniref:DUF6308 family protein n=1 Tax=Arthrobacter sp. B1805 TaxID=2058892 RepID=UPI000CE4B1EA|nr:DUF6308 family protein [Arthrobacter sp. B1805]
MNYPEILDAKHIDEAAELVRRYYRPIEGNTTPRTGTRFDDWAGGGDHTEVANRITADDLVAVSFLSVEIKGRAAIGLLEKHAGEVTDLLRQIPVDVDLWDADIKELNAPGNPADELWHLLRGREYGRWGIGPTRASKLMARKRPRLIPIYDSVVRPLMGLQQSGGQWSAWYSALTDGTNLPGRLEVIREQANASEDMPPLKHISMLRVMDIVLWMHGIELGLKPDGDDDIADPEE